MKRFSIVFTAIICMATNIFTASGGTLSEFEAEVQKLSQEYEREINAITQQCIDSGGEMIDDVCTSPDSQSTTNAVKLSNQDMTIVARTGAYIEQNNSRCMIIRDVHFDEEHPFKQCNDKGVFSAGSWVLDFPYGKVKGETKCDNENCLCRPTVFEPKNASKETLNLNWANLGKEVDKYLTRLSESEKKRFACKNTCSQACVFYINNQKGSDKRKKIFTGQPITEISTTTTTETIDETDTENSKPTKITETKSGTASGTPIGGGYEINGSCIIQYDSVGLDFGTDAECKKLGLTSSGQWKFKSDSYGLISGDAKCEQEKCLCKVNNSWIERSLFDDYSAAERANKNCKNSCVYGCMFGLDTDSTFRTNLLKDSAIKQTPSSSSTNTDAVKLSNVNTDKNGRKYKAQSGTGTCDHYSLDSQKQLVHETDKKLCSDLHNNDWATEFEYGTVKGTSKCSTLKANYKQKGKPQETGGAYCWCKTTEFTPVNQSSQKASKDYWIFAKEYRADQPNCKDCLYPKGCKQFCAKQCSQLTTTKPDWRQVLFK